MWLPMAALQIFTSRDTAASSALDAPSCTPRATIFSEVSSSSLGGGSSGKRRDTNLCMLGMAGPQKDRYREMQSMDVCFCKKVKNSEVSWSMVGKSVCPPSQGRTSVCLWPFTTAGYSWEFPKPVPGPMMPRMCLGFACSPFSETKSLSGTRSSPQEAASKSLMNLKCGIFNAAPRAYPARSPHFSTLAILTVLSKIGPAMPITATSGYAGDPARNTSMASWN